MVEKTNEAPIKKQRGGIKEMWRKFLVALKRRPQRIPLVALAITFLYYALHMTSFSDTTAKIQGSGMGLCGFCVMLFSMLAFMCCMNAFPYRKKVNKPMLCLLLAMFVIIAVADYVYLQRARAMTASYSLPPSSPSPPPATRRRRLPVRTKWRSCAMWFCPVSSPPSSSCSSPASATC